MFEIRKFPDHGFRYGPPEGFVQGSEISLAVGFDSEQDIRKTYDKIKATGQVIEELKESFWGSLFAVVRDKFGKT